MTPLVGFAVGCALLSVAAWRRYPEHGPVALAICFSAARDLAGPVLQAEPTLDAALLVVVACLSGRAYARVWKGRTSVEVVDLIWVTFGVTIVAFGSDARVAYSASVVAGAFSYGQWRGPRSVATDTALVLIVGDAAGLLFGWHSQAIPWQAAIQLLVASAVQGAWLLR